MAYLVRARVTPSATGQLLVPLDSNGGDGIKRGVIALAAVNAVVMTLPLLLLQLLLISLMVLLLLVMLLSF